MNNPACPPIRRALLSVSDKTGITDFAEQLQALGVEILSTGGTARVLQAKGIRVTEVADYTGFPEILSGRVKTLHPRIHAGLLARRSIDDEQLKTLDIPFIDLLVVNLYPFAKVTAQQGCVLSDAIEHIDIGGPSLLRAAAKNYDAVTALVDPNDYPRLIEQLKSPQAATDREFRFACAKKVFAHTAQYDATIANYLAAQDQEPQCQNFPETYTMQFHKQMDLRYGENPHQQAAFYRSKELAKGTLANAKQWQGKALSYNNLADSDAALACVKAFKAPACVIVKHANPCGVAIADSQQAAYQRAFATDKQASFGGIIAFNQTLEAATAKAIIQQQFAEVIIAPLISDQALEVLKSKKNLRVLSVGAFDDTATHSDQYKTLQGGLLVQSHDAAHIAINQLPQVTQRAPSQQELQDLDFAWRVVKYVKSNAIVYAKNQATLGIGAGQMSRVVSAKIANFKAQEAGFSLPDSVMASDAFFPFRDGIDAAASQGVRAVIQPGGSIRDEEVIQAANEAGIAMLFTGVRHFLH